MEPKFQKILITLVIGCTLLSGCKKDEKETKNYFSYGEKESLVGSAFTFYMGKLAENNYGKELYLVSEGITFYDKNGVIDSVSGKGNYLVLRIFNTDSIGIASGGYVYNPSFDNYSVGTFGFDSGLILNFDAMPPDVSEEVLINGGEITVVRNNNEYEISFDLDTEANKAIKGFYKGKLKEYFYKK